MIENPKLAAGRASVIRQCMTLVVLFAFAVLVTSCAGIAPTYSPRPAANVRSTVDFQVVEASADPDRLVYMAGRMDSLNEIKQELIQNNYPVTAIPQFGSPNVSFYFNPEVNENVYTVNTRSGNVTTREGEEVSFTLNRQ